MFVIKGNEVSVTALLQGLKTVCHIALFFPVETNIVFGYRMSVIEYKIQYRT
jgi:hypothetical protein